MSTIEKVLALPWLSFVLVAAVGANVIIYGSVIADIMMPTVINVGDRMVNEEISYTIATINQTITDSLNLTMQCLGKDAISVKLTKPIGSDAPLQQPLDLNGTNVINPQGNKLEMGNLTIDIRGIKQGIFNCTVVPEFSNQTNVTWVEVL